MLAQAEDDEFHAGSQENQRRAWLLDEADALEFLMNNKPSRFIVKGGPGTGKTRFLAEAALEIARHGEKVLCFNPRAGHSHFVDEVMNKLAEEEELREEGVCVTIDQLLKLEEDPEKISEILRKCKLIIVYSETQFYRKFILCTKQLFRPDVVVFNFLNYVNNSAYEYHLRKSRVIASIDPFQPQLPSAPRINVANLVGPSDGLVQLRTSNRPPCFLLWPNKALYSGKIRGRDGSSPGEVKFYNSAELSPQSDRFADEYEAGKVKEIVESMLAEGVNIEDIGIGSLHRQQCNLIKLFLKEAEYGEAGQIFVGGAEEWLFRKPVKHFIYSLSITTRAKLFKCPPIAPQLCVAVTRPTETFHFIGNANILKIVGKHGISFLKWVQREHDGNSTPTVA